jgi:AraC-like DNA-binding protein
MRIPIFQQIDELHHATKTMQQVVWNDFHIYRNESANETCVNTMEPHRCNFFQLSIDLRSDYSLWHNRHQLHTRDNTIYFTTADTLISWEASHTAKIWKGYNINFKQDLLSAGVNNYNFRKEFPFLHNQGISWLPLPDGNEQVYELCERLLYEQQHASRDINIIRHYLLVLLYTIKRIYVQQHPVQQAQPLSREAELAGSFEDLLNKFYLEYKSLDDYASRLYVSPKYLSQVTRNIFGKTAKEMILQRTADEAKSLLMQTNETISQIASRLAFTDTSNFIKFFKRLTGQGPTEYRRSKNFLP